MDVGAFLAAADGVFDGDPMAGGRPRDPAFARIHAEVDGFTSINELPLLNLAARLLPEGECYLEVGSYKGRSTCATALGVRQPIVVMENYLEFGMLGEQAQRELHTNLRRFASEADVRFLVGDCFRLLRRPGAVDRPIGVYFYDGEHTELAHYAALGVIEPHLADEALILIDDATWPLVQKAHRRFLARHPQWSVVRRWDAAVNDDPAWANGLHALRFQRRPGDPRRLSRDVLAALALQRALMGPARKAVWTVLHHAPWLVPLAKKLEPKSNHAIT